MDDANRELHSSDNDPINQPRWAGIIVREFGCALHFFVFGLFIGIVIGIGCIRNWF
jgi:hypothetical protein